jgi:WD40 repeat protein
LVASLNGPRVAVHTAAISPDGALVVVGGEDGGVRIFEAHTGKLLYTLDRFVAPVTALAVSGDGTRLAAGDAAGAVSIFGIAADARSAGAIARDVRCRVPLRLDGDLIVSADTAPAADCPPR